MGQNKLSESPSDHQSFVFLLFEAYPELTSFATTDHYTPQVDL